VTGMLGSSNSGYMLTEYERRAEEKPPPETTERPILGTVPAGALGNAPR